MARFFGTLKGASKNTVTRRGHTKLVTVAASWKGAIEVTLSRNPKTDEDMVCVLRVPWRGNGPYQVLYRGPVGEEKTYGGS